MTTITTQRLCILQVEKARALEDPPETVPAHFDLDNHIERIPRAAADRYPPDESTTD